MNDAQALTPAKGFGGEKRPDILLWFGHLEYCEGDHEKAREYYENAVAEFKRCSQTGKRAYKEAQGGTRGEKPSFIDL